MATSTLKTQQKDASKWDALSLEGSHHKEHLTKDLNALKHKCSTILKNDS
jgi:hypothetical protein